MLMICRMLAVCGLLFGAAYAGDAGKITIFGHRGQSGNAPENTIPGYLRGLESGADGLEVDVSLSADKIVVMSHDRSLKRVVGLDRAVSDLPFAELRKLDFSNRQKGYSDVRMPTLAETLAILPPGRKIIIDFKENNPELLAAVKRELETARINPEQVRIMAFDRKILMESRKMMPQVATVWAVNLKVIDGRCKVNMTLTGSRPEKMAGEVLRRLRGCDTAELNVNGNPEIVTREFLAELRKAGVKSYIWVINKPEDARHFTAVGADGFVSGRPDLIRKAADEGAESFLP